MSDAIVTTVSGATFPAKYNINFTPAQLGAAILLWLAADKGTTVSGTAITNWASQAPAAGPSLVSTGVSAANLTASVQNGRPGIVFAGDGTAANRAVLETAVTLGALNFDTNVPFTIFLAVKWGISPSAQTVILQQCASSLGWEVIREAGGGRTGLYFFNGSSEGFSRYSTMGTASTTQLITLKYSGASNGGAGITGYLNGSSQTADTFDTSAGFHFATSGPVPFGIDIDGGGAGDLSSYLEVVICAGALSDTDRGKVETYLNTKWAIF